MTSKNDTILQEVSALFIERLAPQLIQLKQFIQILDQDLDYANNLNEIIIITHQLAGTGTTFGYPEISEFARKSENLLQSNTEKSIKEALVYLQTLVQHIEAALTASNSSNDETQTVVADSDNSKFNILYVDDDPVIQAYVREILQKINCTVFFAPTGESALHKINSQKFDLILLDMNMSGMSGEETLEAIKNTPSSANIPVMMLTQKDDDTHILACFQKGAIDYILKPINESSFCEKIEATLHAQETSILIADDDPLIRNLLQQKFERAGYQSYTADNGIECIKLIQSIQPNLLILDIMMPGRDGISILRELKSNPKLNDIPVVLLTAKNQGDNVLQGLESGAHDYITKPFDIDELTARVIGILNHGKRALS